MQLPFIEWPMKAIPKKLQSYTLAINIYSTIPCVGNGIQPFIDYFERMQMNIPNKSITFVRAVAEDDLVALHTHQVWPNNDEWVTMDYFRFDENGKIVEHWDVIQQVPESSANGNTMY